MGDSVINQDDRFSAIDELDGDVVTVGALNSAISGILTDTDDLYFDYVVGDVSDFRDVNNNVHFDLDYKDATIHCVLLGYRREWVEDDLEDGRQVAVAGDISYYEARGSCSIMVDDVVKLGSGDYQRIYEENRAILAEDGLLDDTNKQELPRYPQAVGIVTSINSDAREEVVTSIHNRHPGHVVAAHKGYNVTYAHTDTPNVIQCAGRERRT